jgi:hypothetical protein
MNHQDNELPLIEPSELPTPTKAIPGSIEKIEVLRQRVSNYQQLHHPEDATFVEAMNAWVENKNSGGCDRSSPERRPRPFLKSVRSSKETL